MRKSASMSSIMDGQAIYNNYRELSNLRQNHPLDRGLHLPIIKHRDPRALLHKNSLKAHLSTHALSHRDSLQSITPRRDRSKDAQMTSPDTSRVDHYNAGSPLTVRGNMQEHDGRMDDREQNIPGKLILHEEDRDRGAESPVTKSYLALKNRIRKNQQNYQMRMPDASSETSEERKHFSFQQLYKELEELKLKVRELKDMNKKLLESKESGETPRREDLHSMYQLLFIDDFKSEIKDLQQKVVDLRMTISNKNRKIETLERENAELVNSIELYRTLAVDSNSPSKTAREEQPKEVDTRSDDGVFERLAAIMRSLQTTKSVPAFLSRVIQESTQLFECGYARIIAFDRRMNELLKDVFTDKLVLGIHEYNILKKKDLKVVDERLLHNLESPDQLRKFYTAENKFISGPIHSVKGKKEEVYCILQITEPLQRAPEIGQNKQTKIKKRRLFTSRDERLVEFFCKIVGLAIDLHFQIEKTKEQKKRYSDFVVAMTQMSSDKNLQELLHTVKTTMPRMLGYDNVGMLFGKPSEKVFETFDVQKGSDGKFYSHYPIKYPLKIGICGYMYQAEIESMFTNDPRQEKFYQPEVDNVTGAQAVRNMILVLLRDQDGQKVGILQLINKSDGKYLRSTDEELAKSYSKLFGSLISHSAKVHETINLTYALRLSMKNIENALEAP